MKNFIVVFILFMALSINVQESEAACCNYEYGACKMYRGAGKQYFADGRLYSSSYTSCCAGGIGGCNIFCCNCHKGCHYINKRSAIGQNVEHKSGYKIMKGN